MKQQSTAVSEELIKEWQEHIDRLAYTGKNHIDFNTNPRLDPAYKFFQSESNQYSNPLSLIKPEFLTSLENFARHITGFGYSVKTYERDTSKHDYKQRDFESQYQVVIGDFEKLAQSILISLNLTGKQERLASAKSGLEKLFVGDTTKPSYFRFGVFDYEKYKLRNPSGFLAYIVISILFHKDNRISPESRKRAVELLELFTPEELFSGFRTKRGDSEFHNGYDQQLEPSIPFSMQTADDRLRKTKLEHHTLSKHPNISRAIIAGGQWGNVIDWQTTTANLIERFPAEAIQLVGNLLHDNSQTTGAFALLRAFSTLDEASKESIFGARATYISQIGLKFDSTTQVSFGSGQQEFKGTRYDNEPQDLNSALMQLRRTQALLLAKEEEAYETRKRLAELTWKMQDMQHEVEKWKSVAEYWRQGKAEQARNQANASTKSTSSSLDSQGYLRRLNLHPDFFVGLSEEEVTTMVKSHYRMLSYKYHPDRNPGNKEAEENFKQINEAHQVLSDPDKRRRYLR